MKFDDGKPKLTLVPRKIIFAIAKIREYGVKKYKDPDNWKTVEKERYRDAAFRHFMLYLDDPKGLDKESGLPHLWHLACNIAFLCEMDIPADKFKEYMDNDEEFNHSLTGVVNCHRCEYKELPIYEEPCLLCTLRHSLGKADCLAHAKKEGDLEAIKVESKPWMNPLPPIGVSNCNRCDHKMTPRYLLPCLKCPLKDSIYKIELYGPNKETEEDDLK